MRSRESSTLHELVYSTAQPVAGSRDGNAGSKLPKQKKQGSRTGGAGNVRKKTKAKEE
ncbi:MAG: hypothetical protein ACNS60_15150 [Candidatus Cyclobacteriaceae bacterium M2_1C_046]